MRGSSRSKRWLWLKYKAGCGCLKANALSFGPSPPSCRPAIAEAATSLVPIASNDFDRALDTTIIKIRSTAALSQASVCEAIKDTAKELGVGKEAFRMEGKEIGKVQMLRFLGAPGFAEQRARKLMQLQRLPTTADENEEERP